MEELIKEFKIEKINKSGAVFNLEKLDWYNQQYLRTMPIKELTDLALPWLVDAGLIPESMIGKDKVMNYLNWLEKVIELEKERVTTLADLPESLKFIFVLPVYDGKILVWKKSNIEEVKNILPKLANFLNTISVQDWQAEKLQILVGEWIASNNFANGSVLWPLRVSLSGQQNSPGPFEIAEVLGKEESLRRLKIALAKI
jgi:glutamyl/glutaminyl-tRNA synthetase